MPSRGKAFPCPFCEAQFSGLLEAHLLAVHWFGRSSLPIYQVLRSKARSSEDGIHNGEAGSHQLVLL